MSYDRQIDQACPHIVVQEALFIDADRVTVRPIRPIAASASVVVRLNSSITIPASGVVQPGKVISTKEGPFTITPGVNDRIVLKVNNDANQTVIVPASTRLPLARLADTLNQLLTGVVFFVAGRRLGMRTAHEGPNATIFVLSTSTFLTSIGITTNRMYRGIAVAPGWQLVRDPSTLDDRPRRMIVFNTPIPGFNDYVEIDYSTVRPECRRCGGTGFENDWRYAVDGEVVQVIDEALLIQEIQKMFYTIRGSNVFFDFYGTDLLDTIGKKITPNNFLQNFILSDIQRAFVAWQSIKAQQEQKVGQFVSDKEYPFALTDVSLRQSTQDPTIIFVAITIESRSRDPIVLERGVRLPSAALLSSNVANGTIRQSLSNFVLTQ